ncbi:MFS general substrate transporter, partial [Aspergillus sclerotiicarbonarius CBS 121057]
GVRLWLIMAAMAANVFLVAMDATIIATAIPYITDTFDSTSDMGWYSSAYLFTSSVFQLVWGRLYTHFPMQHCLLVAIVIFMAGSALCGAAPSSACLIGGRALAGVGAAGLLGSTGVVVAQTIALQYRALLDSILGGLYGVAGVVAPVIGGALTSRASWRWCFYINLPVGGVCLIVTKFLLNLPPSNPDGAALPLVQKLRHLDPLGIVTLTPMVVCLLLALQLGGSSYEWSNGRIIALLVLSAVFLVLFVAWQFYRREKALIPIRILGHRSILASAWFVLAGNASMTCVEYYLPVYFQTSKGASPLASGYMLLPTILSYIITALVSGAAISRIGYFTPFMLAGGIIKSIGDGLMTTFTASTPTGRWIGYQILAGMGGGLGLQASMLPAQAVLPSKDVALGLAVLNFASVFGGAIFMSVAD